MKTLKDYLYEASLLDIEGTLGSGDEVIKDKIEKWITDNFKVDSGLKISDNPNDDGKYEVSARYVNIKNKNTKSLTNGLFIWKEVKLYFDCTFCHQLTSLEGAPEKVDGNFMCDNCENLVSLKGAPTIVGGSFDCSFCDNLISLEGAPKEIGGFFMCSYCEHLKSLKYAPNKVGESFICNGCKSLTSLEGAPTKIGGNFECNYCHSLKSKDIPATTKVKGKIII